jgi:hypothetical protein
MEIIQTIIIPVPIHINHGHGGGNQGMLMLISFWLAMNLFFIIYFLIRAIMYPIIKNKVVWTKKWYQYILTDRLSSDIDMNLGFVTLTFLFINGMAMLFATADWISTIIK